MWLFLNLMPSPSPTLSLRLGLDMCTSLNCLVLLLLCPPPGCPYYCMQGRRVPPSAFATLGPSLQTCTPGLAERLHRCNGSQNLVLPTYPRTLYSYIARGVTLYISDLGLARQNQACPNPFTTSALESSDAPLAGMQSPPSKSTFLQSLNTKLSLSLNAYNPAQLLFQMACGHK